MKAFLVIIAVLLKLNSFGQNYSPGDFVQVPIPKQWSKEWYHLNQTMHEPVKVAIVDGKLQIFRNNTVYSSIKEYPLSDGKLLAVDLGEFGGDLYYKPNDTTQNEFYLNGILTRADKKLSNYKLFLNEDLGSRDVFKGKSLPLNVGNTHVIYNYKDSLYFLSGLAHMSSSYGAVYKLNVQKQSFKVSKLIDLDDAPRVMAFDRDQFLLVTHQRFYVIRGLKIEKLFDELFWNGFNPSSIAVVDHKTAYIGMVGFYAKIDLQKKNMTLYKYNK